MGHKKWLAAASKELIDIGQVNFFEKRCTVAGDNSIALIEFCSRIRITLINEKKHIRS
jgi:hypothetical protein